MIVFHVDANSAYLSWTAVSLLENGYETDIREIPSVIAGDPSNRHGIILAKSIPAKKCGIGTADTLMEAERKCPGLCKFPPDYDLYLKCSDAMNDILLEYTPVIQRYSVDESFLDMSFSGLDREGAYELGEKIRERIHRELGFTVNIGIGENMVCAKMAGELKKPDMVHTLWPEEIKDKLWPLPAGELFMAGRASVRKLAAIGIYTIGDIAEASPVLLRTVLKSHGGLLHEYANGIDCGRVRNNRDILQKGAGNGLTFSFDITEREELFTQALSLCERVCARVRALPRLPQVVSVYLRSSDLHGYSHQGRLTVPTASTDAVWHKVCSLICECWRGEPVRAMSIGLSGLVRDDEVQLSMFTETDERIDEVVDDIRRRFGNESIMRGVFANGDIPSMQGGVNNGEYIMMGGYRHENNSETG